MKVAGIVVVFRVLPLLVAVIAFLASCQKKFLCDECGCNGKTIVAHAGSDRTLPFPQPDIILEADTAYAPATHVSSWHWTFISAPRSANLINTSEMFSSIIEPPEGIYLIELSIRDICGNNTVDTLQIVVGSGIDIHAPVADAGPDITDTIPVAVIVLDGTASTDPDNNIILYQWRQLTGPGIATSTNFAAAKTEVRNFVSGLYEFELTVTDAGGLTDRDTMVLQVYPESSGPRSCDPLVREEITGKFIRLSGSGSIRAETSVAVADNLIFFGGGLDERNKITARVDIWNMDNASWKQTSLSIPRVEIASVVAGNKVFFAGGMDERQQPSKRVDVYDIVTGLWTNFELSKARFSITTATLGSKVFFINGRYTEGSKIKVSDIIDVYDVNTGVPGSASLGYTNEYFTVTAVENKLYLAGGTTEYSTGQIQTRISVYDASTGNWQNAGQMAKAKYGHGSAYLNGKLYWAGGFEKPFFDRDFEPSCLVEVRDIASQSSTFINLSTELVHPITFASGAGIFFLPKEFDAVSTADIYQTSLNKWQKLNLTADGTGKAQPLKRAFARNGKFYAISVGDVNTAIPLEIWQLDF